MNFVKRLVLLVGVLLLFCPIASAQGETSLSQQIAALTAKYQNEKRVMTMECNSGFKLKAVKAMLRASLGEEFANRIEAVTIIFYEGASAECVSNITADIALITRNLQKHDLGTHFKDGTKGVSYVQPTEDGKGVSDIVVVMDSPTPGVVYIKGNFKAEK